MHCHNYVRFKKNKKNMLFLPMEKIHILLSAIQIYLIKEILQYVLKAEKKKDMTSIS